MEASRKLGSERQDEMSQKVDQQGLVVAAILEGLGSGGSGEEVKKAVAVAAAAAARRAAGERVEAYAKDRAREEEARWQVGGGAGGGKQGGAANQGRGASGVG